MADGILTAERLREVVDYDPETGTFTRKIRLAQRHRVGDRADFLVVNGTLKGYRRISIDSRRYLAHRCAWLYVHNEWPSLVIDHINGDRGDNRIVNLRDVERALNSQNEHCARVNNQTGYLGVVPSEDGTFMARIKIAGKNRHLGSYSRAQDAHAAYLEAKRRMHPGCSI